MTGLDAFQRFAANWFSRFIYQSLGPRGWMYRLIFFTTFTTSSMDSLISLEPVMHFGCVCRTGSKARQISQPKATPWELHGKASKP
jgi:hypothetical protein